MLQTMEELYKEFSEAFEWASVLTGRIGEDNRFAKYKEAIRKRFEEFPNGMVTRTTSRKEFKEDAEAQLEARVLIDIHQRFSNKKDKYFVEKLNNIFGGLYFASDEPLGTPSFARDIQAELLMAAKCKDPSIVDFASHDIVYNFELFKFGLEVKRLNSDNVLNAFERACGQLEKNWSTASYGLVVICLDRFLFFTERNGIVLPQPTLFPRESWMIKRRTMEELTATNKQQLLWFHHRFENDMRDIAINYPKVSGYLVYSYYPAMVGDPVTLVTSGFSDYMLWDSSSRPDRKTAFERFMKDQFYPDQYVNYFDPGVRQ